MPYKKTSFRDSKPGRKFGAASHGRTGGNFAKSSRSFGDRDAGAPMLHKATCSECNTTCEVPFKPNGKKPVLCGNCFKRSGGGGAGKFEGGVRAGGDRSMHDAVCDRCGKDCQVPFRPLHGKPIYCATCLGHTDKSAQSKNTEDFKEQFAALHAKLDAILKAVGKE